MTTHLARYRSVKIVHAGEILRVSETGCTVRAADGGTLELPYQAGMTARMEPSPGDRWVVYEDGYASISPRTAFEAGYVAEIMEGKS